MTNARHRCIALLALLPALASAQGLIVCDFQGTSPSGNTPWTPTTFLAPGVTYSGWDIGPGAVPRTEINDAFGFNIETDGDDESPLSEALADGDFIGFTVTPPSGGDLDLGGLEVEFSIERQTFHAPRRYALFASATGFTEGAQLFATPRIESDDFADTTFRFFIAPDALNDIAAPLEFRLYAFGGNFNHATALTSFSITQFPGETFTLALSAGPGGSVEAAPSSILYREGEVVRLDATPSAGHRFGGWSGDLAGLGNPSFLTMDSDKSVTGSFVPLSTERMEIAMNLASVSDFGSDWPFLDHMRRTRDWMTRNADGSGAFDNELGDDVPVNADGYPIQVPFPVSGFPPQNPHTILVDGFPVTGAYEFRFRGTGSIRLVGPSLNQTLNGTGPEQTATVTITDRDATAVAVEILATNAADPIRDFRLITPGFEDTFAAEIFHPTYLDSLRPFYGLRFMDWGAINGSPVEDLADRTTLTSFTQARREGASIELMAALANRLDKDVWYCVPHQATDEYVREAARLLRDLIEPGLEIYVEYSNETWNTSGPFTQTPYVQQEGVALNLDPDPFVAAQRFVALRSTQIWEIFEDEFGGGDRLVNVLATQSANTAVTQFRVDGINDPALNPRRAFPEALAIAPYFGPIFTPEDIIANGYPTIDALATTIAQEDIEAVRLQVRAQAAIAARQGYRLICYEGGQHYVGVFGAENDDTLTALLTGVNRDPRMFDRYNEYLTMLREEGVEQLWHFSHVGRYGKFGSWGVQEVQDQPLEETHKLRALLGFIEEQDRVDAREGWELF